MPQRSLTLFVFPSFDFEHILWMLFYKHVVHTKLDIYICITKIGKNMIFLRKIVIFHTKYPNKFRASLRSAQFF
jgi:hypothetical protein